jgi:phosphoglycerol transferase MdoB-like AlkP superfamily enzyme
MTDPTFHLVGNFLELNQITGGPKYLRKDDVCMVSTTNHRVTLYVKGRPDSETLSFVNSENQQRFVQQLLADVSSDETPFKDCMNTVKDAMENIKRVQYELSGSLENVTSKIQDLKEDIKKDLQEYIDDSLETKPEKENPYDALDNTSTDTTCNALILLTTILLSILGVISLQKNLPLLT